MLCQEVWRSQFRHWCGGGSILTSSVRTELFLSAPEQPPQPAGAPNPPPDRAALWVSLFQSPAVGGFASAAGLPEMMAGAGAGVLAEGVQRVPLGGAIAGEVCSDTRSSTVHRFEDGEGI